MANITSIGLPGEVAPVWRTLSPSIPQQGSITANPGLIPATQVAGSVTVTARFQAPHQPLTIKVTG